MLFKIFIGSFFYKSNNSRSLRLYFMFRYLYNLCVVYPLIILLKFVTATYSVNYFLAGGILLLCELIITAIYLRYLCIKKPIENIQDIPGFTVKAVNSNNTTVIHAKVKDSADYILKLLGKKKVDIIIE